MINIGQADIYRLLKENKGKKFTQSEIAHSLSLNVSVVCNSLKKLVKYKEIRVKVLIKEGKKRFLYYLR